jgi:hypothetical protein
MRVQESAEGADGRGARAHFFFTADGRGCTQMDQMNWAPRRLSFLPKMNADGRGSTQMDPMHWRQGAFLFTADLPAGRQVDTDER